MMTSATAAAPGLDRALALNTRSGRSPLPGVPSSPARPADRVTTVDLSGLFAKLRSTLASRGPSPFVGVQREIDGLTASIKSILNSGPRDVGIVDVSNAIDDYTIGRVNLDPGRYDIDINILQSAQTAGLYLSLGTVRFGGVDTGLNFNGTGTTSNSTFQIEISGALGSRELSFSSGQTLAQVAAAINTFTDVTGVVATASASPARGAGGIALRSSEFGSAGFVSVEILNEPSFANDQVGVFRFQPDDASSGGIDRQSRVSFTDAAAGIGDTGQDVLALINGIAALGVGKKLFSEQPGFTAMFDLRAGDGPGAQELGSFQALTLVVASGSSLGTIVPQGGGGSDPFASTRPARPAFNQLI
jgi:hypothetical protein